MIVSTNPYSGIFPIAPTAFLENGDLDLESQRRVIDCIVDQGVDGICILANFSEQFLLTDAEREKLLLVSLEQVAGRVPVIVTCSHFSTRVAVDRVRQANAVGAAMVMVMPPYHGALLRANDSGVYEFFSALSDAVNIPIMIQDAPLSGVNLSVSLLARIAKELPQVSYFKIEAPGTAGKIRALIDAAGDAITGPFDGEEGISLMADLDAGATGTMTSALLPELIRPILENHLAGDRKEAEKLYSRVLPLINHENRQCGLRACKTVMYEGGVITSDAVRHPLEPLSSLAREELVRLARDLDLIAIRWGR